MCRAPLGVAARRHDDSMLAGPPRRRGGFVSHHGGLAVVAAPGEGASRLGPHAAISPVGNKLRLHRAVRIWQLFG